MGTCFGTQVKAESASINSGANDPGADSKKSSNSLMETSHGGMEVLVANNRDLSWSSTLAVNGNLHVFSYDDLKTATRNFHHDYLLGKGSSSYVFKGYIDEQTLMPTQPERGIVIAVKKLYLDGFHGHKEWLVKLHFLGTIHHPNLVKLFGFCAKDDHRLLVYEFMPRGSLVNHLFGTGSRNRMLPWSIRMKITINAARGLAFLHDGERPIIYKAFKTSNILLDLQFNAKLSAKSFGFAEGGAEGVSTGVMGTYGYAAPEYVATGRLTAKSNVYSFGVVLLEILTGRRAVDRNRPCGEQNLVEWSRPYLSDKHSVSRIVDQKLEGQFSVEGAQKAARVARHCLRQDATLRPTMKQVVDSLEELLLNAKEAL